MHTDEVYEMWTVTFIAWGSAGWFRLEILIAVLFFFFHWLNHIAKKKTLPVSCLEAKNLTLCLGNRGEQYRCLKTQYVSFPFPGGSNGKDSACKAGDLGSIPGLGRSLGGGNGNPWQYYCLENPMDRGDWRATIHGVTKSQTQLSN